tara:strand:+ start:3555 stop:3983 length:429 start_codon:yes stop_codon:yes gene_type:complete
MKGFIYGIFNNEDKICYIGSTIQSYPKKRFYRHRDDMKKSELFAKDCEWKILGEKEYEYRYELRREENDLMLDYRGNDDWKCININLAFVPDDMKKSAQKAHYAKYCATEKGKEARKWQNYRRVNRKKICNAINAKGQQTAL